MHQLRRNIYGRKSLIKFRNRRRSSTSEAEMQTQPTEHNIARIKDAGNSFRDSPDREEEEMSRSALAAFRAKEEEIERKKLEVREKVFAQLGRVEEESKRLAEIREVRNI